MNPEIYDDELGTIKKSGTDYGEYVGTFQSSKGEQVPLMLWMEDVEPPLFMKRARQIVANFRSREEEVRHAVAVEYLNLYNSVWREEDEITLEEFNKVFKLKSVEFDAFNNFRLVFTAADLFSDHSLSARLNTKLEIESANLEG